MDMLNNIWTAVSTPNEMLINICGIFFIIFFESQLTLYLIKMMFNINVSKIQSLIYIVTVSITTILSMFIIPEPYNLILNYLSFFLVFYFLFKVL